MTCSYCSKPTKHVLVMQEDVPGLGPCIRHACFPCLSSIGERTMKAYHKQIDGDVRATSCARCAKCGGTRREDCKSYPNHGHDWCDCQ